MTFTIQSDLLENDDIEFTTNSDGDFVLEHPPTGATLRYDSTDGTWHPSGALGTSGEPIAGTSHFEDVVIGSTDSSVATFSQTTANLSWQYDSLVAVPNWDSFAGSNSVWSFSVTGQPRRIHVEHDGSASVDDYGGVLSPILTSVDSLGSLDITFENISFTNNDTDENIRVGITDVNAVDTTVSGTGNGIFVYGSNLATVDGGTETTTAIGTIDWSTNHDISILYDGSTVSVEVDGQEVANVSYTVSAAFSPFIQARDGNGAETVEAERVTIEQLTETL